MADLSRLLFFFLVVPIFLVREVSAITNHTVGDQSGWTTGVDYSSWAAGKTFFVGDFLVFRYKKGVHNVLDVDVSTFSKCAKPKDQRPLNTGNDFVPLTLPGFKWFISTIGHDCKSGQKLIISVENPPPPASVPQFAHPLSTLPSAFVPAQPIPMPPASSPSAQSPAQNQTTPQLPIVPAPSQNIPPSHLPGPSATAPPPSGAAAKSPVSAYLGVLVVVAAVLAGTII
ncbi:cucumber peeling cupredoxin-like [Cucurbita moschata]|uniref:Cucumber peeling cupredoxin-like n=1 Tax=Cucurbita moschata TaxID=3662 RepID=A0A6J1E2G0_CUCMO|nr:cucumber peeling cupredoxin-like [Cucurbita moschata]